jgi:hypothetical protein
VSAHGFLTKNKMTVTPCPAYSPGSVSYDSFLFPEFKKALQGKKFNDITMTKTKVTGSTG